MAARLPRTALDSLEEGIQSLRRCAEADLSTPRLAELVGATLELRNRLDAARARRQARRADARRAGPDDPSLSCAAWLREAHRLGNGAAWGQVRLARQLRDLPRTAQHAMAIAACGEPGVIVSGGAV